jgi:hypothetical protein
MDYKVTVEKLTNIDLLHRAASFTTGHESRMSLKTAYKLGHSLSRTQIFVIELRNIPLFVASQLVRSHVGVQFFQRSRRTDRGGADFTQLCDDIAFSIENLGYDDEARFSDASRVRDLSKDFDRYAPTDLMGIANADMIMQTSRRRLCSKASQETREVWQSVVDAIETVDPDLAEMCVPMCVYQQRCPEYKGCKFLETERGRKELSRYNEIFK